MKYEFKPFAYETIEADLKKGWHLTFRITEESPYSEPREVQIVDLGYKAANNARFASIDLRNGGEVRLHDSNGFYYAKEGKCCLDLILYREAGPKPREIQGMAYVHPTGKVVSVVFEDTVGQVIAAELHPVPCTITIHEPA